MKSQIGVLLREFTCNPPAGVEYMRSCSLALAFQLPEDYQEFLRYANGGCGRIGIAYVDLWRIEELGQRNADYATAEFAPGLVLFGSDGGGEAFAFDTRMAPPVVVVVPFVGLDLASAELIAPSFTGFLERVSTVGPFGGAGE